MQCEAAACTKSVNQEGIIGNSFFSYIVCSFSLYSKFYVCVCCCMGFCEIRENIMGIMGKILFNIHASSNMCSRFIQSALLALFNFFFSPSSLIG